MDITPVSYYDQTKFSNSFYPIQLAIHTMFANYVFRGNADRIIYASEGFSFRQRLNQLSKLKNGSIKELQLPFMSYYRQGNWEIDDRPSVQNATSALSGFPEENIGWQNVQWLNVKTHFTAMAYFPTDVDAQLGYERLMWIKHPVRQQFRVDGVMYKGFELSIPVQMEIESLSYQPAVAETDWLTKNRIVPISFSISIRSVILSQLRQGAEDTLFPEEIVPVLTEKVKLDFLSYYFKNSYYDQTHIDFEVAGTLDPDISLSLVATIGTTTETDMVVEWDYDDTFYEDFEPDIILSVNGILEYTVPLSDKTYTLTDLSPESLYNITLWAKSLSSKITKATASGTTTTTAPVTLKGIKGSTF
jgi:hypothetical protein